MGNKVELVGALAAPIASVITTAIPLFFSKKDKDTSKEKNELFKEEITTQYKVYCEGEIKLFSSTFTDDNRNNCLMIYNGEASFLKQYIKIDFNTVLKEN